MKSKKTIIVGVAVIALCGVGFTAFVLPSWAADAVLRPPRRTHAQPLSPMIDEVVFAGSGVALKGCLFPATGEKIGTIIYLHGVADNKAGVTDIAERFSRRGFDVLAYDSRAHGYSAGDHCTYGYYEKEDLRRVLDAVEVFPVILLGKSMGAAIALQAAAVDNRIGAVIAAETFADFRSIVRDRAPFFVCDLFLERVLRLAEERAVFKVDDVSPVQAATHIQVPVLLIHGAEDHETSSVHSQRVFEKLPDSKRIILVPDAGHNQSINEAVWKDIEEWVSLVLPQLKQLG